jgi:plastocyanin
MSQKQRKAAGQRRRRRIGVAVAVAVVALLALGGILFLPISDDDADAPAGVAISMVEYAFAPSDAVAAPGEALRFTNDGAIDHNYLVVDLGKGIELVPGDEGTLTLPDDASPGTYRVVCDLPGHTEAGMVGTLEIT